MTQPASEIEQVVKDCRDAKEIAISIGTPTWIVENAREHKIEVSERMPIIVSLSRLKRVITQLRLRLHHFLDEIEDSLK